MGDYDSFKGASPYDSPSAKHDITDAEAEAIFRRQNERLKAKRLAKEAETAEDAEEWNRLGPTEIIDLNDLEFGGES